MNQRIKVKLSKCPAFKFKPQLVNDSSHQTKELTTWFLNLPLDESIDNKRHKIWSSNPRPHEAQLEDQKPRKAQEGHIEEEKAAKPTKDMKSGNLSQNVKEELRKAKEELRIAQEYKRLTKLKNSPWMKLLLTLSMYAFPLR
jgi:hypothetical protein